ncbi:MAG: hypothetical protein LBL93_00335 [Ruminococcus sp.]|jgi:hypothetical protein|nr:hypothetical protein [Ruminococcus sp.]
MSREELEKACQYIANIVKAYGADSKYTISENEEGTCIGFSDKEIIGNRGECIDALQYLATMIVNKDKDEFVRIIVDTNNYRTERRKRLMMLAEKACNSVISKGKAVALPSMNPYERRIIHAKINEIEGVYSKSIGDEPDRKIIVYPDMKSGLYKDMNIVPTKKPSRGNYSGKSGGNRSSQGGGNRYGNRTSQDGGNRSGQGGYGQGGGNRDKSGSRGGYAGGQGGSNRDKSGGRGGYGNRPKPKYDGSGASARDLNLSSSFESEFKKSHPRVVDNYDAPLYGTVEVKDELHGE